MPIDAEARVHQIAEHVRAIMQALDLDLDDPNLSDTPERVAQPSMELFAGAVNHSGARLSSFANAERYDQMVSVTNPV